MTNEQASAIEELRQRYRCEYRRIHKKEGRVAFLEEISRTAAEVNASAWAKFAEGLLHYMQKDNQGALVSFDEAILLDPTFPEAWNRKGDVLHDLKRYEEAMEAYDKAIALDPGYDSSWYGKGCILFSLKRYEEALVIYDKAIALGSTNAFAWNDRGNILYILKRYEEALSAYDKAIEIDPGFAYPWLGKGNVRMMQGESGSAILAYRKAIGVNRDFALAYYNTGVASWFRKEFQASLKAFQRAMSLNLEPEWQEVAESWIIRASLMIELEKAGKPIEAREQEDRSSAPALITELFRALEVDLPDIQQKKALFEKQMAESVGKSRVVGAGAANDMLLVLRDWNSYSPILRRELRNHHAPGPDERLGGGYFLAWKGHGIVIDPGVDFVTQLYRKGFSIADVDTIIITHCHLDHVSDLESLVDLNYRYNQAKGFKPHPRNDGFRQLQFLSSDSAFMKYREYLKTSGCCRSPRLLARGGKSSAITDFIDVLAIPAEHVDINGRDDEAVGLVLVLKDDHDQEVLRLGITSDTRWVELLPKFLKDCDIVVAHLGSIEVAEKREVTSEEADGGSFLKTDLRNHLGTKGCFRLLHAIKPKLFVMGEFGEELVQTRFKILNVFNKLKPDETRFVLGGDSNLAIGLGSELSVCCSHHECAKSWRRIPLDEVQPVLGGDYLFQYICSEHKLKH